MNLLPNIGDEDPLPLELGAKTLLTFSILEALERIEVQYRLLPTVASPEEALANSETRIHDYGEQGNIV